MGRTPFTARLLTMVLVSLALACGAAPAASALPAEGVFEKCPLATNLITCVSRLSAMHAGGVSVVVLSPRGAPLDALAQYAAAAHGLGISVMWSIGVSDWWEQPLDSPKLARDLPEFAAACGCQANQALFAYLIGWLRALPATYGYYAADDTALGPGEEPAIAAFMGRLKALDPVHPSMIGWSGGDQRDSYEAMSGMLAQEIYPVTTSPILPAAANQATWTNVEGVAAGAQSAADAAGKPSAFILQAFSWGDNLSDGSAVGACSPGDTPTSCYARLRYPSPAEQLALRDAVLDHAQPALILWYSFPGTFGSAIAQTGTIYPAGADAAASWSGLVAAIQAPWSAPAALVDSVTPPSPITTSSGVSGHHHVKPRHRVTHEASRHHRRHRHRRHRHHHRAASGRRGPRARA